MKLSNILCLTFLASSASASCGSEHPNIANAINKFCGNQGIMVPSTYARNGASTNGVGVSILGTCNPSQWVPKEYCLSQFRTMCDNGRRVRRFGRNKCQKWAIQYPGGGKKAQPKAKPGGKKMGAQPRPQKPAKQPDQVTINL